MYVLIPRMSIYVDTCVRVRLYVYMCVPQKHLYIIITNTNNALRITPIYVWYDIVWTKFLKWGKIHEKQAFIFSILSIS